MGRPGQTRFTGERPVAVLMGGNIDGSSRCSPGGGGACGTLLGPEGAARLRGVASVRVQAWRYTARVMRGWWSLLWSGVRWGVCELDSGCEHLILVAVCDDQVCSLCVSV